MRSFNSCSVLNVRNGDFFLYFEVFEFFYYINRDDVEIKLIFFINIFLNWMFGDYFKVIVIILKCDEVLMLLYLVLKFGRIINCFIEVVFCVSFIIVFKNVLVSLFLRCC